MIEINKEILRFLVERVDWNTIMLEVVDDQPETVAELLNGYFAPKTQKDPGEAGFDLWDNPSVRKIGLRADLALGLDRAFAFAIDAVNTKVNGRQTTNDMFSAIRELRTAFKLPLEEAKDAVELMMDSYEADSCYYPKAEFSGSGYKFS